VHVIPRYAGDVEDPRGGVRHVVPSRGNYLALTAARIGVMEPRASPSAPTPAVLGTEDAPLLPAFSRELEQANAVDLAVAFILDSGLGLIIERLKDVLAGGGRVRVLTGDYLGVTEPRALLRLLDLDGRIERRVFETDETLGFHPKAYLIRRGPSSALAYVGSSNLTSSGLQRGVEWNHVVDGRIDPRALSGLCDAFERLFRHPRVVPLTEEWVARYRARHVPLGRRQPV